MLELWNFSYSTHKNKFKVDNKFSNSGYVELGESSLIIPEVRELEF